MRSKNRVERAAGVERTAALGLVWAAPDVMVHGLAPAPVTSGICFPTMWPLYSEARWH